MSTHHRLRRHTMTFSQSLYSLKSQAIPIHQRRESLHNPPTHLKVQLSLHTCIYPLLLLLTSCLDFMPYRNLHPSPFIPRDSSKRLVAMHIHSSTIDEPNRTERMGICRRKRSKFTHSTKAFRLVRSSGGPFSRARRSVIR